MSTSSCCLNQSAIFSTLRQSGSRAGLKGTPRHSAAAVPIPAGSHSRTALTQEEEEQKYRDYESLVEEIANICGIQDKESRDRILCWKARRRYMISLKYNRKRQAVKALGLLYKCGGLKIYKVLKDSLWACLENIRAVKKYRS